MGLPEAAPALTAVVEGSVLASPSRRRWLWPGGLAALLLAGLLVRAVGIRFGLGHEFHPDEGRVVAVALAMRRGSVWDVSFWNYPPALASAASLVAALVAGAAPGGSPAGAATQLLVARLVVLASGSGRLPPPGRRPRERRVAPTARRYLLAGAAVGVAAAFKYVGALAAVAVVVAHFASGGARRPGRWAALGAAGAAAFATAVSLDFQVLRHTEACLHALADEAGHYGGGSHAGYATEHAARHALVYAAACGVGPVAAALAIASPSRAATPGSTRPRGYAPSCPRRAASRSSRRPTARTCHRRRSAASRSRPSTAFRRSRRSSEMRASSARSRGRPGPERSCSARPPISTTIPRSICSSLGRAGRRAAAFRWPVDRGRG